MLHFKSKSCFQVPIFSTVSFGLILIFIILTNSFISNTPISPNLMILKNIIWEQNHQKIKSITSIEEVEDHHHTKLQPPVNITVQERKAWFRKVLPNFKILKSTNLSRKFDARVGEFLGENKCRNQFFMTWIAPLSSFGERQLFTIESLFKAHPEGCLIILSRTMDSAYGNKYLKQFLDFGNKILPVTPDLIFLLKNTPAESWFSKLKKGKIDPGEIPLAQNLSNLIRLAVLYKYGGIYLDTDFIILRNFSRLRNSIGAQSEDLFGNWTRLNNALLIFDKNHWILFKFLEEFASSFDGNRWGSNGPYLVSRVVTRIADKEIPDITILPPNAFYPVDWTKVERLFEKPSTISHSKWVEDKLIQLHKSTYGVHLWNKKSFGKRIEEGSIVSRLMSENCVVCKSLFNS